MDIAERGVLMWMPSLQAVYLSEAYEAYRQADEAKGKDSSKQGMLHV